MNEDVQALESDYSIDEDDETYVYPTRLERKGRGQSPKTFKRMAQKAAPEAIGYLLSVVKDSRQQTKDRIAAAKELLDRGFGKALQEVNTNSNNTIRVVLDTSLKKLAE